MTILADAPREAHDAVRARRRQQLDELDYRRSVLALTEHGYNQNQIARWLGITQPSVASALKTARKVTRPVEGFSGATPMEICQRYAAGLIDRAQLVDELARFPYAPRPETDGVDWLVDTPPGTWMEVTLAHYQRLIDDAIYDEVFQRRHPDA
ncbi:hypothetical protein JVX92_14890 (plasmid) [Microbacterium hominis]|uniref:hypothetical protein n=1 Tax=Microbacterium hominis TaxID=162426 RepID=UPI0019650297|nr:hypothetical protein [Microbacterium hominis]QRY42321.1 hypothetical protein JVX92_14890 [Microbacterium hominis]